MQEAAEARRVGLEEMGGNYPDAGGPGPCHRSLDAGGSRTSFDFYRDRNHSLKQDEISMKSEFGVEARRKFSIVNPHDAKVSADYVIHIQFLHIYIYT